MEKQIKALIVEGSEEGEVVSIKFRNADERTENNRLEEELVNASIKWEDTFDALDDMIAIMGSDMKIVQSNKAFKNAVGTNDVSGKYCYELIHGTDSPPRYCSFAECLKTGKSTRFENYEEKLSGKWFEYNTTPLHNSDFKQFVISLKDINERKNMEMQVLQDQKLESIGRLAAGIAHEINTPTQYVGDNITFLKDSYALFTMLMDKYKTLKTMVKDAGILADITSDIDSEEDSADLDFLNEEIPNALSQSVEGIKRITEIVSAMKAFSHPGSDDKTLSDLNNGILTTITVCRNEWKYVADLKTSLQPDLPQVLLLQGEFNQVILNIIVNAAHAIGEKNRKENQNTKGLIEVASALKNRSVEVRISDTGGGIPEDIKSNIFDPFFTTKPVGVGTGQGLAIARNVIVNKHGGTLELETKDGTGSTFIINIPLK
ncbi:MAG: PAS domain S-box protein [Deltaproteobacteria bacterium]|nr:PAS domain S-box protein [Deltaproteobacteria bacterium]